MQSKNVLTCTLETTMNVLHIRLTSNGGSHGLQVMEKMEDDSQSGH
jgi:hypothetical protein